MSSIVILKPGFSNRQQEAITRSAPAVSRALTALGLEEYDVMIAKMEAPPDPGRPTARAISNSSTRRILVHLNLPSSNVRGEPAKSMWLAGQSAHDEIIVQAVVERCFGVSEVASHTMTMMALAIARLISSKLSDLGEAMFGSPDSGEPAEDVMPPADDQVN